MRANKILLTALALLLLPPASGLAQQSLGDLARQLREERAKSEKKPVKEFTNDNLPARPPEEGRTAASGMSSAPTAGAQGEKASAEQPGAAASATGEPSTPEKAKEDKIKTKEYWQGRFAPLRQALASAQEVQQTAEDELNLLELQQAREADPNVKQALQTKVSAKQAEIESDRAATAKAQKDLADLEKEFNESGAPAEWSKAD